MRRPPSFSIVINTLNRRNELERVLESLQFLEYKGDFEVVVVNGPSTDTTKELLAQWQGKIKIGSCEIANLSVSRNIGIAMAAGDIIAFLDDDSIPESNWLTDLSEAYEDDEVGGAGGFVFDHTGFDFQYKYATANRLSYANQDIKNERLELCFPGTMNYPALLGANSSFRRKALMQVGGFDEEFEYFLDETDVCLRIVDAGYVLRQLDKAFVHHKYAASHIRGTNRIPRNRYPIIKNRIYFMLKHGLEAFGLKRILEEISNLEKAQRWDVDYAISKKLVERAARKSLRQDLSTAVPDAIDHAKDAWSPRKYITDAKYKFLHSKFKKFAPLVSASSRRIVLTSIDFPDHIPGGIATFTRDLAQSLAAQGNFVHVITKTPDNPRVDFENGVWMHRIEAKNKTGSKPKNLSIPNPQWDWSASALAEVERISERMVVDLVEAPIWDCEGVAFAESKKFPLITSLHTPLKSWVKYHPEKLLDTQWVQKHFEPLIECERRVILLSSALRANSNAIVSEIGSLYGIDFSTMKYRVIPHGLRSELAQSYKPKPDQTQVLYTGRLEPRKGIKYLLQAAIEVASKVDQINFQFVGRDIPNVENDFLGYEKHLKALHPDFKNWDRIQFLGEVGEEDLIRAYSACSFFVAPSLFESFGLIAVEALRAGKPVIAANAGGFPEIIKQNYNGVLVEPASAAALVSAILNLHGSPAILKKLTGNARPSFEQYFTSARMARESLDLYELIR